MDKAIVLNKVSDILEQNNTLKDKLKSVCVYLKETIAHYDWVGFYFANHQNKTLYLGPYAGDTTDHTQIPFGKGICGQVAESNETFLVEDVHAQDNYIACSIHVKSEIVVPLFLGQDNIGQIDIDSHTPNAFTEDDEHLLKAVNMMISEVFENDNTALKQFI